MMMIAPALLLALALQTPAPSGGPAPDPALNADLRCLAYLSTAVEKAPAMQQPGLAAGLLYFVGRIDARAPGFDYLAALAPTPANAARLADLNRDAARCIGVVAERGRMLIAAGQALRAK